MIQSFGDKESKRIFEREYSAKLPNQIQQRARMRLAQLDSVERVEDMRLPSGNRLHKLSGTRDGEWAVRVNEQWRITFEWGEHGPENVKIEDYH
jgi:proteic killer suppression protein